MNNNELLRRLMDDDPLAELQAELDKETALPEHSRNYAKIAELTAAMAELNGCIPSDGAESRCADAVHKELSAKSKRRKIGIFCKWLTAAAACFVVVFALNTYTMSTFGEDIISAVVKLTKNGFSLDLSREEPPSGGMTPSPTEPDDTTPIPAASTPPQTMTTPAASVPPQSVKPPADGTTLHSPGNTDLPTVTTSSGGAASVPDICLGDVIEDVLCGHGHKELLIPDDHVTMQLLSSENETTSTSEDFYFTFGNAEKQLDIIIEAYKDKLDIPMNLVPSESNILTTVSTGYFSAYLFEEDSHITAIFVYDTAVYTTVGCNMTLDEMMDVVTSYRAKN